MARRHWRCEGRTRTRSACKKTSKKQSGAGEGEQGTRKVAPPQDPRWKDLQHELSELKTNVEEFEAEVERTLGGEIDQDSEQLTASSNEEFDFDAELEECDARLRQVKADLAVLMEQQARDAAFLDRIRREWLDDGPPDCQVAFGVLNVWLCGEKQKTEYGTKRQRLGNESMRNFDACALCLQRARDPIACDHGHLFCKECAYADLLNQKKDIKRQKERLERLRKEAEEEKQRALEAARERVLRDFEKGQLGLSANLPAMVSTSGAESARESRAGKRKLDFDGSTVETLAREAEEAALRQIEREQAEALRHKLPDFWLPSLTPTYSSNGPPSSLKDVKVQTMCRGGEPPHPVSLKSFAPVQFSFSTSSNAHSADSTPATNGVKKPEEPKNPICPSCKTNLSNNKILSLMRPCSHVVCKNCTDSLVRPASQCIVCDRALTDVDIVELKREGTGFAGGGLAETTKKGLAFQG